MATGSIRNAIKQLEDDLIVQLNAKYKKGRKNFIGQVGRMSFAQTLNATGRFQGLRIRPVDYNDGIVSLSKITLIGNISADFNIYIIQAPYRSTTGTVIKTYPITSVANSYVSINVEQPGGLKLPLVIDGEMVEYFVYYDRTEAGGFLPKDNKITCSTCGSTNSLKLRDFLDVKGMSLDDLGALTSGSFGDYSHGLTLDVAIKCDNEKLFCGQYQEDDAIATTMAHAVRFKAGELLIEEVLKSPDVNRYTTMAREYLWGKRNHFRAEYDSRVAYLANEAIDVTASNCYVCREGTNQPFVSGIYS